jgi:hypothetical protein
MSRKIKAEGDTWTVRLGDPDPDTTTRPVLFFCSTTDQRPYRVVEVPADRFADSADLEKLDDAELAVLYGESRSMGVLREYPTYPS